MYIPSGLGMSRSHTMSLHTAYPFSHISHNSRLHFTLNSAFLHVSATFQHFFCTFLPFHTSFFCFTPNRTGSTPHFCLTAVSLTLTAYVVTIHPLPLYLPSINASWTWSHFFSFIYSILSYYVLIL